MSQSLPNFNVDQLNPSQKLELIAQLWDSLPNTTEAIPIPEWHKLALEQRLAAADADPDAARPWDEIKRRLRDRP